MPQRQDNTKFAFVCTLVSLIGLLIMLASNSAGDLPSFGIKNITKEMAGDKAVLCGTVSSKYDNGKGTLFVVLSEGNESVSAVFFSDVKERAEGIKTGSQVCVEGTIQIYRGRPELIARKAVDR